jgi:REP element-mobilizing transposase RayT
VHFLFQTIPISGPSKVVQLIKNITETQIFERYLKVKRKLRAGDFWTRGYYIGTAGKHGDEELISNYKGIKGELQKNMKLSMWIGR